MPEIACVFLLLRSEDAFITNRGRRAAPHVAPLTSRPSQSRKGGQKLLEAGQKFVHPCLHASAEPAKGVGGRGDGRRSRTNKLCAICNPNGGQLQELSDG